MKVVIFCGGFGTRLWPVSRKSYPKQFIPLVHGKSFLQLTYERYRKVYEPEEIFISTDEDYVSYVRKQVPGVPRRNIIAEPERKDTLAACGLATAIVNKYYPGESIHISWAKFLIARESVFLNALSAAEEYANESGLIMAVDSKPAAPSVHFGWVKKGKELGRINGFVIKSIERHVEKPKKHIAERLYESGDWLINTGFRVWNTDQMLSYYKQFQPAMYKGLSTIAGAWGTKEQSKVLKKEYSEFKKDSVEYGIFEKLEGNVRGTIEVDMGWEDVGISWQSFYKGMSTSKQKTVVEGGADYLQIDAEENLVFGSKGKMISIIGLSNIAVIDTPNGLLVCPLDKTHKVKKLYKKLERYHEEYTQ